MGIKTKKFRKWKIAYTNELELDEMLNELYVKKYYNWKTTKEKPVIFDVGALIGETALYFKDQYPMAKIVAFEPSPRSFALLKKNVSINNLSDTILINAAVAGKEGKMDFYTSKSKDNPWGRGDSLKQNQFNDKQKSKVVKVAVVKLSNYIKGAIDLLKIDIEGAETEVIQEIELKLKKVRQIIMEFHGNIYNPDNNYQIIMDILKNNNFQTQVYFSRWLLPSFLIGPLLFLLHILKVEEYWLRIYAQRSA